MSVQGIDYYEGNGSPSLDGLAFALHKATEGLHSTDTAYGREIARIRTKVPVPGAYHFAWPTEDAKQQVGHFLTIAQPKPGELLALDLERYPDGRNFGAMTNMQVDAWQQTFLQELHDATGGRNRVGLYVDSSLWAWLPSGKHGDFLWIAEYGVMAPHARGWELWQNSANGIDHDIALFDTPELMRAWANLEDDMPLTPADAKLVAETLLATTLPSPFRKDATGKPLEIAVSSYLEWMDEHYDKTVAAVAGVHALGDELKAQLAAVEAQLAALQATEKADVS